MKGSLQKYSGIITMIVMSVLLTTCKKDSNSQTQIYLDPNAANRPVASFSFAITSNQVLPCTATFTNTSQRATSYQWYFGDGNTSYDQNPTNIYTGATYTGLPYTVKLVVTNSYGKDSVTKQIAFASTLITGVSANALPTSVITITGINFSAGIANNSVTFNGVAATISTATATALTVAVPATATSGRNKNNYKFYRLFPCYQHFFTKCLS